MSNFFKELLYTTFAAIFMLVLWMVVFPTPAKAGEFVCRPVPQLYVNVAQSKELFIANNSNKTMVVDDIILADNPLKFNSVKTAIEKEFNASAPFPVDEFLIFELKDETNRKLHPKFTIAYVYKNCVMNFGIFNNQIKSKILGQDV